MNAREATRVACVKAARCLETALGEGWPTVGEGDGIETERDADLVAWALQGIVDRLRSRAASYKTKGT